MNTRLTRKINQVTYNEMYDKIPDKKLNKLIYKYMINAIKNEPRISSIIKNAISHIDSKLRLEGFDRRFKTINSILIKLLNAPDKQLRDTLRYTIIIPSNFADTLTAIIRTFNENKITEFKPDTNFKNTFCEGNEYKGVNASFAYNGFVFEIQFHTEESFKNKKITHDLYKQKRIGAMSECDYTIQSIKFASAVKMPAGLENKYPCKPYKFPVKCLPKTRKSKH